MPVKQHATERTLCGRSVRGAGGPVGIAERSQHTPVFPGSTALRLKV